VPAIIGAASKVHTIIITVFFIKLLFLLFLLFIIISRKKP